MGGRRLQRERIPESIEGGDIKRKTEFETRRVLVCKEVFQVWPMFIIIFILLPDIHEFLVWCLNVLVGFFSLFFLHLGLLALASCLIINWFYIPCFGVSYEISVFPPLFSFLKKSFEISFNSLFYLSLLTDA